MAIVLANHEVGGREIAVYDPTIVEFRNDVPDFLQCCFQVVVFLKEVLHLDCVF
jgi:hypothetical protein